MENQSTTNNERTMGAPQLDEYDQLKAELEAKYAHLPEDARNFMVDAGLKAKFDEVEAEFTPEPLDIEKKLKEIENTEN